MGIIFVLWLFGGIISIILSIIDFLRHHNNKRLLTITLIFSTINVIFGASMWSELSFIPLIFSIPLCGIPALFQIQELLNFDTLQKRRQEHAAAVAANTITLNISRRFGYVSIDDKKRKFMVAHSNMKNVAFDFSDLLSADLIEVPGHAQTKHPHRIARAVIGDVIAGPVGAVVGGVSGKSTSYPVAGALYISASTTRGTMKVSFFNTDTKTDSFTYHQLRKSAEETMTGLNILLNTASSKPVSQGTSAKRDNAANAIQRYKNLLDSGAITQEEYNAKKKKLLNL